MSSIESIFEFFRKFIGEGVRPDGRTLETLREVSIISNCIESADASSLVRVGKTSAVCGVKLQLAKPHSNFPNLGFFVPNVEFSPSCKPGVVKGPPSNEEQILSGLLETILIPSNVELTQLDSMKKGLREL